jgi:hypothetical protein
MCTLQNAAMRLLGLWSANCVEDESFRYRFRLEDFLNEENIAAVAERDLFAEHDPERLRRRLIAEEVRRRNLIRAWQEPRQSRVAQ